MYFDFPSKAATAVVRKRKKRLLEENFHHKFAITVII
jgi:hypothetical protein